MSHEYFIEQFSPEHVFDGERHPAIWIAKKAAWFSLAYFLGSKIKGTASSRGMNIVSFLEWSGSMGIKFITLEGTVGNIQLTASAVFRNKKLPIIHHLLFKPPQIWDSLMEIYEIRSMTRSSIPMQGTVQ